MLRRRRSRRILATLLVVLGGVLMMLAPEIWAGLAVLVLGVVVELAGIALERKA
jgi:drug/metabolite transporter (DMT)-like permease